MISFIPQFQNNRPLPLHNTHHTYRFFGGELPKTNTLSLDPAVIISPVFVKAAERKQAAVKKPASQTGREMEGGRWRGIQGGQICCDIK